MLHITFNTLKNFSEQEIQNAINELAEEQSEYKDCTFNTIF